jgi:multiple sugar transport system substrate-binding protein
MQGRRRTGTVSVAIALLVVLYCGAAAAGPAATLQVWHLWDQPTWELQLQFDQQFMARHPDIKVESVNVTGGTAGYADKVLAAAMGRSSPDLMYVWGFMSKAWIQRGLLLDITPYMERSGDLNLADFFPTALEMFRSDKRYYGLPYDFGPFILYYNIDRFQERGVQLPTEEWKWEGQFLTAARKLTYTEGTQDRWAFFPWSLVVHPAMARFALQGFGAHILDDSETRSLLNSQATRDALGFWLSLIDEYRVAPTMAELNNNANAAGSFFNQGRLAMFTHGSWFSPNVVQQAHFDWDVGHMPAGPVERVTQGAGSGYAIPAGTAPERAQAAFQYLEEYLSTEGQCHMWGRSGRGSPTRRSAYRCYLGSPLAPRNARLFPDILSTYTALAKPMGPAYDDITNAWKAEMIPLFQGKRSIEEAIEVMDQRIQQLLAR